MRGVPPLWGLPLVLPLLALPPLASSPVGRGLSAVDAQLEALAFQLRGARPAPEQVVILAIDSPSLTLDQLLTPEERQASPLWRDMGPWPWPRALQAELAAQLLERGARQVVLNVVLAEPSRYGPSDDATFRRRLEPWRSQLVLAAGWTVERPAPGLAMGSLRRPSLVEDWAIAGLPPPREGLTTVLQSPQGVATAIPGAAWMEDHLGGFQSPLPPPLAYAAARRPVPRAPLGINYPGPVGSIRRLSAWQLPQADPAFWRDRTVVIGATTAGLGDQLETPFGPQSGTDVQAAAIASVLSDQGLRPLPVPLAAAWLLLTVAISALALARSGSSQRSLLLGAGLSVATLCLSALLWGLLLVRSPASALALPPILAAGLRAAGQASREQRQRAVLQKLLASRLDPALLDEILRDPAPFWTQAQGARCRCVVLFSDLEGFTALSSRLEPAALFALLNRYFDAIGAAVVAEGGLLDKYIGDALMAEFGVPRSRGDQQEALAALRAVIGMRGRLAALNQELAAEGLPPLRQRLGLHIGEVMAGNLGSQRHLEFTVVGAAVNVASRLEALGHAFPDYDLLLSGELLALLPTDLPFKSLGEQCLRGWPEPIAVYGLERDVSLQLSP
ncbi:adenylate/guanylate cyclase domain-containing protein [Cyanobium sp. ATX 6A2]|uniref:adenylate/guanylate cyclase domain-containing protein n=1 Tax=Cyanobium sp. ATX 6A2 TaxID=2823700 RepID=UPI0020CB862B|nr:adenylate/guanylate cyclase domain-containing protein [Cyanobium sp. ATX 6A2]